MALASQATIRPFRADDYEGLVEVFNRADNDDPISAELLRHFDETRDPRCKQQRLVIEQQGRLVAAGEYDQNPGMYHPQKFKLNIAVLPESRRQGLGTALYDGLLADLSQHQPVTLRGRLRAGNQPALTFVSKRGFEEEKRDWESRLEIASFDLSRFAGAVEGLELEGVVIKSLRNLERDPDMPRKFYALFSEVRQDVPRVEPATAISFENFYNWTFKAPDFIPEGSFVALDGDRYIGMSQLWKGDDSPDVFTGLTAVKRAYRGRKIALALKLRGIAFAQRIGAPVMRTDNDSLNMAMLRINDKLGFVRQPALINLVKHITDFGDA